MGLSERIRRGESIPFPITSVLNAMTPFTRLGMQRRLNQPRESVDATVIAFGNITAGGTGKTPAVIERAQHEITQGNAVAVLTRGYHGKLKGGPHVIPDTVDDWPAIARGYGDEPALIARRAPGVRVVKYADRVAAARHAIDELGCDTLILDDAFQYVRLERDENILVIDASNPFGTERLVPRGFLREPLEAMQRATHIILTRCDQAEDLDAVIGRLRTFCPDTPIRPTWHKPTGLWRVTDGVDVPLDEYVDRIEATACGIGNPEAFQQTVWDLGARPQLGYTERNHGLTDLSFILDEVSDDGIILTTEKDAIRIPNPPDNLYALRIELADFAL